jgi:hypothetical protein
LGVVVAFVPAGRMETPPCPASGYPYASASGLATLLVPGGLPGLLLCSALPTLAVLLVLRLVLRYGWVAIGSLGARWLPVPDGPFASWFAWALRTLLPIVVDAPVAAVVALRIFSRETSR